MTDKFVRQLDNEGSILNVDNKALQLYKKQKQRFSKIDRLEQEVIELKKIIEKMLNKEISS